MAIKQNIAPYCPKPDIPEDASLTNWTLNHDATRSNPRMRFSMSSIPATRWAEIDWGAECPSMTNKQE